MPAGGEGHMMGSACREGFIICPTSTFSYKPLTDNIVKLKNNRQVMAKAVVKLKHKG